MNFRATSFAIGAKAIQYSAYHSANVLQFQEQISSGLRMQRPSDDPISFRQVTTLTSRLSELAADTQSLNSSKSILNTAVVQMQEFSNLVTRAKVLTQQGIQSLDSNEREALALEVDGLLYGLQQLSVSQFDGAYIFGGTRSDKLPFEFREPETSGGTLQVNYFGSAKNSRAFVGEAVSVDTYYSGSDVFGNLDRGETLLFGSTGVKTGTGTDTLVGRSALQVTHLETSYLGSSGLQTGVDSAELDSIVGDVGLHTVEIIDTAGDGSAGTISLNGGVPVSFTNADSNLEVNGKLGEKIYVDTTAIAAGFNGTIDLRSRGNLSVDGGASQTEIDFSANQVVTDAATERFVTIDSTEVKTTGTDYLEFPGTSNAFQVLYELTLDLRNTRDLSGGELADSLDRRLGELESLGEHALQKLGEQSTSLQTLQTLGFRIEDLELSVETQLNDIQATNIPEAVLRLENSQALLQYTYAVTAQISSLGLLDFLR